MAAKMLMNLAIATVNVAVEVAGHILDKQKRHVGRRLLAGEKIENNFLHLTKFKKNFFL